MGHTDRLRRQVANIADEGFNKVSNLKSLSPTNLVAGGAGHIDSHAVKKTRADGYDIAVTPRYETPGAIVKSIRLKKTPPQHPGSKVPDDGDRPGIHLVR